MQPDENNIHIPPQHQEQQPGKETEMTPPPKFDDEEYMGSNKLKDKIAIITGGDSGIGRAIAIIYAKEGADIVLMYLNENEDAQFTKKIIEEKYKRRVLMIAGDIGSEEFCCSAIEKTLALFKKINILVNNAGEHQPKQDIQDISEDQLKKTFETNVYSMFYLTKAVLPHLHSGDTIINTASVVAYKGSQQLMDYAATKGAIVAFTQSLAINLAKTNVGVRVNAVAPGPIWTPLIPSSYSAEETAEFGKNTLMGRPGQPSEVAPCYVFLASKDSSYMTGEVLHPNGGTII